MAKLYFIGGEDVKKRNAKKIDKKAFADAGGAPKVLEFPWTAKVEKKEYRKTIIDYFKDIGAKKIIFAELSDSLQTIEEKIKSSDLIYLPGGETKLLVKRIKDKKVDYLLQKYNKIIVGNSAGSLALCRKYVVIKGQDGRPKTIFEQGLGPADFAVAVHYKSLNTELAGKNADRELITLSKKVDTKIYAIPETSAVVYNGENLKFLGNVYLFYKGKKVKV